MSEALEEYRQIAGRFTALVEGVPDDETWAGRSPVEGWQARDVVRHLVEWFPGFIEAGAGVPIQVTASVDEDPGAAWRSLSDQVEAVLADPDLAARTFSNPHIGEVSVETAVSRFFTADVFMHSWDLARATGQDDTLDPERCEVMLEGMGPMDDLLRASGQFGPKIDVPADADAQTRFLAFIGRDAGRGDV